MIPQYCTAPLFTARCRDGALLSDMKLQQHLSSRATRLVDDTTRFLLVTVEKKVNKGKLRATVRVWIQAGIKIDGIHYRFLGLTESQATEAKLVFFREDGDWTVERLLASLLTDCGELTAVYDRKSGYGECSARLGLSFSSMIESLDVPREAALEVPDWTAPSGSLHSDRYGMIRDSLAIEVCRQRDLRPDTTGRSDEDKPVAHVGARNSRPHTSTFASTSFTREDSQVTLVDQPDTGQNEAVPSHKRPSSGVTQRQLQIEPDRDEETARARVRSSCAQGRPSCVSVLTHPKPKEPVAARYPGVCPGHISHEWHVIANGTSRNYMCQQCGLKVQERKKDGYWVMHSAVSCRRRELPPTPSPASGASEEPLPRLRSQTRALRLSHAVLLDQPSPLATIPSANEEASANGDDESDDDRMSIYESAVEEQPPKPPSRQRTQLQPPRRSSGGTTDPRSSLEGFPCLRRLPKRPGSDVSSPLERHRHVSSRQISRSTVVREHGSPADTYTGRESCSVSSSPEVPPQDWPLVSENPKPTHPVASAVPRCSVASMHSWQLWGCATCRRYTCRHCALVIKERKTGAPEVWAPAR
ncbi:RNA dependent RNA polymerase-domain-containing protein [Trametes maxima]|nr:RNA dependent RNA polymerase-domain-containing protein [Trametes maxima]